MFAARRLQSARPLAFRSLAAAPFHSSAPARVNVEDRIPDVELHEGSPGNKVNLAKELTGRGLIIGVPAAFSPACSESHIPGFINSAKLKDAGSVFVVAVNDAFYPFAGNNLRHASPRPGQWTALYPQPSIALIITKAWGKSLDPEGSSGIRFLADPSLNFTNALDLAFDGSAIFGGHRGKRYVLVVDNGVVKEAHVEPDNTGLNVSAVDKVLGK